MMVTEKTKQVYRKDAAYSGDLLTAKEREKLLKPYLPAPKKTSLSQNSRKKPLRTFLRLQVHIFLFYAIHIVFSIYIRIRQAINVIHDRILAILFYHHRAPELIRKDVNGLTRIPEHVSVMLDLRKEDRGSVAIENLLDDVAEISAWCACARISRLSIYEKTGMSRIVAVEM